MRKNYFLKQNCFSLPDLDIYPIRSVNLFHLVIKNNKKRTFTFGEKKIIVGKLILLKEKYFSKKLFSVFNEFYYYFLEIFFFFYKK